MEIDPVMHYSIERFMLMLIPKLLLDKLPSFITALLVTAVPYTPIGIIVFVSVFLIVYLTDIFGLASATEHYCRYNKPETKSTYSLWSALKNSYILYFIIAYTINLLTVTQYKTFNINTLASVS